MSLLFLTYTLHAASRLQNSNRHPLMLYRWDVDGLSYFVHYLSLQVKLFVIHIYIYVKL